MIVTETLKHTPAWIYLLLAYLIWQGVQSLRTRTQPVWQMLIAPAAFAVSGLLLLMRGGGMLPFAAWAISAFAIAPIGLASAPRLLGIDRDRHAITRAGSIVPLVRNLVVFTLQYAIAVALARQLASPGLLAVLAHIVSGASIGYFAGWGLGLARAYRAMPSSRPTSVS